MEIIPFWRWKKKIKPENLQSHYSLNMQSIKTFFKIIRQIQYCEVVNIVEENLPHFKESKAIEIFSKS